MVEQAEIAAGPDMLHYCPFCGIHWTKPMATRTDVGCASQADGGCGRAMRVIDKGMADAE